MPLAEQDFISRVTQAFDLSEEEIEGTLYYVNSLFNKESGPHAALQRYFNESLDNVLFPLYRTVTAESWQNITQARDILNHAGLLVVFNHPHGTEVFPGALTTFFLLDPNQNADRAFLTSHHLVQKPSSKRMYKPESWGKVVLTHAGFHVGRTRPISVYLEKFGQLDSERRRKNLEAKFQTAHLLSQPNTIVGLCPEGNIQISLGQAKEGLGQFIVTGYGYTLPVTTNIIEWLRGGGNTKQIPPLTIHRPIENKCLMEYAHEVAPENPEQVASDYVMCHIASALPPHQRGDYESFMRDSLLEESCLQDEGFAELVRRVIRVQKLNYSMGRTSPPLSLTQGT